MKYRFILLSVSILLTVFAWEEPLVLPFKVFVVYLHELSHAAAAIITGGEVRSITLSWDQSGITHSYKGSMIAIAIAGYLGSILFGLLMTFSALKNRYVKSVSLFIAVLLTIFAFLPKDSLTWNEGIALRYIIGLGWGGVFFIFSTWWRGMNRTLLLLMGALTLCYGLYDLNDFFLGDIMLTDAGILASALIHDPTMQKPFAYVVAIIITLLSFYLVISVLKASLKSEKSEEIFLEENQEEEINPEITDEMIETLRRIKEMQKKGE